MTGSVDVILMASGFSSRFGHSDKLLQPFRGKPMAARALELALGIPGIGQVIFVYASDEVGALAEGLPVLSVRNENPGRGQCESIRLGVSASMADYYLFLPCDQPLLDAATVRGVLEQASPGKIIVPAYKGKPGNPALFSSAFRRELLELGDNESGRAVKRDHPQAIITVEIDSPWPLADIDSQQDLAEIHRHFP